MRTECLSLDRVSGWPNKFALISMRVTYLVHPSGVHFPSTHYFTSPITALQSTLPLKVIVLRNAHFLRADRLPFVSVLRIAGVSWGIITWRISTSGKRLPVFTSGSELCHL